MSGSIHPIVMPKWGLSMQEGKIADWTAQEGSEIQPGDEILDVETDKIAGSLEASEGGVLRRIIGQEDETLPVGALIGVLTQGEVSDAEVEDFISQFQANFVPEEADGGEAESPYKQLEMGDQRLRYSRQGEGHESVMLIHGFGGDLDNWLFNLGDLAAHYTVYALDLPGHGESSKQVGDGSLASLADSVVAFMDAMDIESAHLVGHSLGGAIIQQLALRQPQRARSLALICSAGLGPEINSDYTNGFIDSQGRRDTKAVLQHLFADTSLVTRQMVDDILKYKRLDGVSAALRSIAEANFTGGRQQTQFREHLPSFPPVLALWGSEDRIIPATHAGDLPTGVSVEIIDGAGHMVQMEAAQKVNAQLKKHFEEAGR